MKKILVFFLLTFCLNLSAAENYSGRVDEISFDIEGVIPGNTTSGDGEAGWHSLVVRDLYTEEMNVIDSESKIDISRGEMLVRNSPVPLFVVDYTTNEVGTYKITQVADYRGNVESLKYENINSSPVDISITVGDFIYSDENTSSDEKTSKLEFIESFSTSVDYTNNGLADIILISLPEDSTSGSPYKATFSSRVINGIDILTSRHIFCKKQTETTVSDGGWFPDVTTVSEYSCFLTGSITYSVKCSGYISEEAYKNASLGKYVMDVTVTVTAGA